MEKLLTDAVVSCFGTTCQAAIMIGFVICLIGVLALIAAWFNNRSLRSQAKRIVASVSPRLRKAQRKSFKYEIEGEEIERHMLIVSERDGNKPRWYEIAWSNDADLLFSEQEIRFYQGASLAVILTNFGGAFVVCPGEPPRQCEF